MLKDKYYIKLAKGDPESAVIICYESMDETLNTNLPSVYIKDTSQYHLVNGLDKNKWHYVSIHLKAVEPSNVGFTSELVSTSITESTLKYFSSNSDVKLYLGLTAATFKEVKLFNYPRKGIAKYTAHTQFNPSNEFLTFYYPLDGKATTKYFYNAVEPEKAVENYIKSFYWTENIGGNFICPEGFYYQSTVNGDPYPNCIKQKYLKSGAAVTITSPTLTISSDNLIVLSTWLYFDKPDSDKILLTLKTPTDTALEITSETTGMKITCRSCLGDRSIPMISKGWAHIGYTTTTGATVNERIYINSAMISSHTHNTSPTESNAYN